MPKFNANLSLLFTETDLPARFGRAAQAGFSAVELQFPYIYSKLQLADALGAAGLELVLHNLPAGDWAAGDRGIAIFPERRGEFQDSVGHAIGYAQALGCRRLNCLAGCVRAGGPGATHFETLVENLRFAAGALEREGIALLVEPINTRDVPGFFVSTTRGALAAIDAAAHDNIYLQYDIYHMQIMEGDLTHTIESNLARIDHMQLADNPGRHEPGTGEINFANLFAAIDHFGYDGWIGCEYIPQGTTEEGLGWLAPYLKR